MLPLPGDAQTTKLHEVVEQYEICKRVLRGNLPPAVLAKGEQFVLACEACGLAFRNDSEVGMMAAHYEAEHGPVADGAKVRLNLVYVGTGMPPKGGN